MEVEHYIDGQHNGGVYNSGNLNTYGYTYQNPVLYVDPNGKQSEFWNNEPSAAEYIVSGTISFIGDARAGVMNLVSRALGDETRYRGDGGIGVVKLPSGSKTTIVGDVLDVGVGVITAKYGASGNGVLAQEVKGGANESKNIVKDVAKSSREARREVMRKEGIPTSEQPVSQSKNSSGREYTYEVPKPYGGVLKKSVQQQTMDRSHPGENHWEGGIIKFDPRTGEIRINNYGRPKLQNNKSKVDY